MANRQRTVIQEDLRQMVLVQESWRDCASGVESRGSDIVFLLGERILIAPCMVSWRSKSDSTCSRVAWVTAERVPYGLLWGGKLGEMEFGGVGRGWVFVAGTLLAATAAKLSRPKGFGISRAEDAMAAIS